MRPEDSIRLQLIRHGETDFTAERRYCGVSDPGLSPVGRRQVEELASRLSRPAPDRVVSSDLARARETSAILFRDLPRAIEIDERLREIDFGSWEGRTHEELLAEDRARYESWMRDPFRTTPPGGERFDSFADRVRRAFESLRGPGSARTIAVVAHGGPIGIIRCLIENRPPSDFGRFVPPPATVVEAVVRRARSGAGAIP